MPEEDNTQPAETTAFITTRDAVQVAQYRIGVLSADIERHLLSLREGIEIRTGEMQATLSLEDIEKITDDLVKARDALLAVLIGTGESRKGAVVPNEDAHEKLR